MDSFSLHKKAGKVEFSDSERTKKNFLSRMKLYRQSHSTYIEVQERPIIKSFFRTKCKNFNVQSGLLVRCCLSARRRRRRQRLFTGQFFTWKNISFQSDETRFLLRLRMREMEIFLSALLMLCVASEIEEFMWKIANSRRCSVVVVGRVI